jgi:hypothetical protein
MPASRRSQRGSSPASLQRLLATRKDLLQRAKKRWTDAALNERLTSGYTLAQSQKGAIMAGLKSNLAAIRRQIAALATSCPLALAELAPDLRRAEVLPKLWQPLLAASPSTAPASAAQTMLPGWGNGWAPPQPRRSRPELGPILPIGAPKPQGKDRVILVELGWE